MSSLDQEPAGEPVDTIDTAAYVTVPPQTADVPRQVSAHAVQFLSLLGRTNFEFRCFSDQKAGKALPQILHGTFDEHKKTLRRLNEQGYGIFAQVNAADGKGNKNTNIVSAPCYFVDLDGPPRENIDRVGTKPTMIVETSPRKWHAYWRVRDIPIAGYKAVQQRLARLCESDRSVNDLARVMRLPGFLHQKKPEAPFLVKPIHASETVLSNADFLAALDAAEKTHGIADGDTPKAAKGTGSKANRDIARAESALRYLIAQGLIDLSEYATWLAVRFALHAMGEDAWLLFLRLSSDHDGFVDEADCRKAWDETKEPTDRKPLTMATFYKQASEAGWSYGGGDADGDGGKGGKSRTDQAIDVLFQAEEAGDKLWLDLDGQPYVTLTRASADGESREVHALIDSTEYRGVLRKRFLDDKLTKVLATEQENQAVKQFGDRARAANERHPVYLRSAIESGVMYVDLGRADGKAVRIDKYDWEIVANPPARFVQGSRGELPLPQRGGTLADFERHFNVSPSDLTRIIGCAIASFRSEGPFPILFVEGPPGSGKSNIGDKQVALTDPPTRRNGARFSLSADERNLHVQAQHAKVLFFDNLSTIGPRDADALCRVATGGASSYRTHHTMTEETQMTLVRPIVATCISTPSDRNDLLSRCIRVRALPLTDYQTEEEVWEAFDNDRPKMLGFLFDAIKLALRNHDEMKAARRRGEIKAPRLADVAVFVEGAAEALGLQRGEFCALLNEEQASIQAEAVSSDDVADGILRYFSREGAPDLDVTAAELLVVLHKVNAGGRWPAKGQLRGHIDRITPGLRASGIEALTRRDGHSKVCKITLRKLPDFVRVDTPLIVRSDNLPG